MINNQILSFGIAKYKNDAHAHLVNNNQILSFGIVKYKNDAHGHLVNNNQIPPFGIAKNENDAHGHLVNNNQILSFGIAKNENDAHGHLVNNNQIPPFGIAKHIYASCTAPWKCIAWILGTRVPYPCLPARRPDKRVPTTSAELRWQTDQPPRLAWCSIGPVGTATASD